MGMKEQLEAARAEAEAARAELEALKASSGRAIRVVAKPNGIVHLSGIRFPYGVALYPGEWDVIKANLPEITAACTPAVRKLAESTRASKRSK